MCLFLLRTTLTTAEERRIDATSNDWISLFNGKDLSGWYTFLQQSGRNNDPKKIFKVERGMIHLYGLSATNEVQETGYLASEREFSHCRIRVQYKWGEKRFPPGEEEPRDSGLFYYLTGADGPLDLARALQLQIAESNTGDLLISGGLQVTTSIESELPPTYSAGLLPHRRGSGSRIAKSADFEDRKGWNTVEVILDGQRVTHIVNGRVVLRAWNLRQPDPSDPSKMISVDHGRLLLEGAGSEVWFRNLQMKPLASPEHATVSSTEPCSLDSKLDRLLEAPHSRDLLEALLSPDVLDNPLLDREKDLPAREVLPDFLNLEENQLKAIDRVLLSLSCSV